MTDMTDFERQVASEMVRRAGPVRPVDDLAVYTAIAAATRSPRWRFWSTPMPSAKGDSAMITGRTHAMFTPFKAIVAGALTFVLLGVLSIAQPFDQRGATVPGAPVASPSPSAPVAPEASSFDRWAVADLSAFEAAFESGDYDQVRALFTDDGIITTAGNMIALYYGDTAEPWGVGTWDVNGSEFKGLARAHAGEDFTVLGTPIQIGDNTVAFGWAWSSGVSGTALLHLRDGKIVVAVLNPSQYPIPFQGGMAAE